MTTALKNIEENTTPGAGITVNLIYVNPRAMAWQVPLLQQLRAAGAPIQGMTIGAGVPSLDVANEYIQTLGLKHIAFKPGSLDGIQQVINIAKANPTFPVILQWTGGRGGGHHSFEDFHQPILQMYGRIRAARTLFWWQDPASVVLRIPTPISPAHGPRSTSTLPCPSMVSSSVVE